MKLHIILAFLLLSIADLSFAQKVRISDPTNKCVINTYTAHPCYCTQLQNWSYSGTVTLGGYTYSKLASQDVYIREDTIANVVYIKWGNNPEFLLYDYNWEVGDTLGDTKEAHISQIDTVLINGFNHKVFHVDEGTIIIEGIGNTYRPFSYVLDHTSLTATVVCFSNANGIPNIVTSRPNYLFNLSSCKPVAAPSIESETKGVTIYPQPAHNGLNIQLTEAISGKLTLTNSVGQIVYVRAINNEATIRLNNIALNSGMYYYHITCVGSTTNYSGKLMIE